MCHFDHSDSELVLPIRLFVTKSHLLLWFSAKNIPPPSHSIDFPIFTKVESLQAKLFEYTA